MCAAHLIPSRLAGWASLAVLAAGMFLVGRWGYERFIQEPQVEQNISCYVYRDVNRNGVYDLADRPYAGARVTLQRPSGDTVPVTSNQAGFANFAMALGRRGSAIHASGDYGLRVEAPAGWGVTSGNAKQSARFEPHPGSPAGLVNRQPFTHVGVAPDLIVTGRMPSSGPARPEALAVRSPEGETRVLSVDNEGEFGFSVRQGVWILQWETAGGERRSRTVTVGAFPVRLSLLGMTEPPLTGRVLVRTADFESLPVSSLVHEVPNGYLDLEWSYWVAMGQSQMEVNAFVNGTISGDRFAYNSSGHPAIVQSKEPFDFVGGFFTAAWPSSEQHPVVLRAWRGSERVAEDRFWVKQSGPLWFSADYCGITRLEVASDGYWQVLADDLTFAFPGRFAPSETQPK